MRRNEQGVLKAARVVVSSLKKSASFFYETMCSISKSTLRKVFKISENLMDMLKSSKTSSFLRTQNLEVPTYLIPTLADSLLNCDCFIRGFDCSFETRVWITSQKGCFGHVLVLYLHFTRRNTHAKVVREV